MKIQNKINRIYTPGGRVVASSNLVIPTNRKGVENQQSMRFQRLSFSLKNSRFGNKKTNKLHNLAHCGHISLKNPCKNPCKWF